MSKVALAEVFETPADVSHRFAPINYYGQVWDFAHLDAFAIRCEITDGLIVDTVVLFSSHCFTHSFKWDTRQKADIPPAEIYNDGKEKRVLSPARYEMSRSILRGIVVELPKRHITVANEDRKNYMTCEVIDHTGTRSIYAVFFDVERDTSRKKKNNLESSVSLYFGKWSFKEKEECKEGQLEDPN